MYKKVTAIVLAFLLAFTSFGIAAAKEPLKKNSTVLPQIADAAKNPSDQTSNLSPAEKRKLGYVRKPTMGLEYKIDSALWKKYDDFIYLDAPEESDSEDISKPIYDGRYYSFISSDLLKQYDETSKITDRTKRSAARQEILNKAKGIYSYVIYRKDKLPSAEQIKKDVKMPNVIMLGEDGGYVFYFGYADYDDKDLPASDKAAFKALCDDAEVIMDTMTVFKPVSTDEGIKSLKTFKFNLKDLDGNGLNESILKKNKITMVNIWATYCGYCIDEMPYIQELADEYKDKGFGVIGIAGDVYSNGQVDAKLLDKAKKIVKDTKVKYPSLIPDDNLKYNSVLQYLTAYPTTFFVDSEGNIVGNVIVGELSKNGYEKNILNLLNVSAEEKKKMGYVKRPVLGIDYKTDSALWKKYDDFIYLDAPEESDPEDISKPIYDGRYYSFVSSDLIKQYDETSKITDRAKRSAARQEILNKAKGIYSYVIYRKDKLPSSEQIKKDVKMPNVIMLGEDGGYVFYFGYANYDDKDLPASDKVAFKALCDDAEVIMDTMTVFKPVSTDEGIKSLKTFKFNLKDLDGNGLNESILKKNKITMVNIWATYCGYCIDEMPYIQELADEYKNKGFGVIGIAGDVYSNGQVDAKLLDKAKKIVKDTKVKYPSIIPDDGLKYDSVLAYITGYPTTFFVDSEGNIVGNAIIGELSKNGYEKNILNLLNVPAEEKKKMGYVKRSVLGIEYKTDSSLWKKYDDFIYLDAPEESDPEDISKPIYDGRYYSFVSSDLLKQYDETSKIIDRAKRSAARQEILNKAKGIYSYVIYRKDKLPSSEQIKKDVKMPNVIMLGEDGGYVFYFGYAEYDDKDLPASDKAAFKALCDDAEVIRDTMTVFKPVSTDEGIKSIKTFKFKLKDLDGNELTESIFKNNKVTMVNIWATYCGYCIDEMPYIQELADEYKDKGFGVIGIAGDVYSNGQVDAKLLDKAKKIVKDTKVKYPSIIPDDNLKRNNVLQYLTAYPTTFFVDSKGNIVGNAIVGELSKNGYEKTILNLLNIPSEEKRKMGYVKRPVLGIEYKTDSSLWKKYDDFIYLDAPEESDPEDISKPIYDGRYYSFVSSDLLKQYDETSKITDRAKRSAARQEILNKAKGIYSYIIYRKDKLPSSEQIKKDVKMPNVIMLGEDGGYVFYFGYANYDDKDLPASDKAAFKALCDDAEVIMDTMTVFKPVSTDEGIKSLKTFKFTLKDLDGNELTESIFKKNKITMVNIWATYCGYCIDEMPYIQELADEYKDKGFGVIGIAGDVYSNGQVDAKLLDKAKKIVKDTKVKYPSIIPDDNLKYNSVLQYLTGYPTTFFVDSKGNIVGNAIVGSLTKDEFKKVIEDTLSKVK